MKVLIVDDHPSFRSAARLLLEHEGFEVIGEAEDGASGLAATSELSPDLVLLDINLPDLDGFDVASRITLDHARAEGRPDLQPRPEGVRAARRALAAPTASSPRASCRPRRSARSCSARDALHFASTSLAARSPDEIAPSM